MLCSTHITNRIKRREDYALQVVPDSFRQWSWLSLVGVMLAGTTAMFYFVLGASFVQQYGTINVVIGMTITAIFVGTVGFILSMIASETGLDMDLITSGSGFGFRGAGFTALIYALAYVIYFAIEGSIIASAVHAVAPVLPLWFLYIAISAVFIPLTWYGLTSVNYLMWISLPFYAVILVWSIVTVAHTGTHINFWGYQPSKPIDPKAGPAILQLLAIAPSMITPAASATDVGRFIPKKHKVIAAFALGYVLSGLTYVGAELLGAWFSLKLGQSNPGVYFPALFGIVGTLFLITTQIRINAVNTYSGSLAFTTFFSRIFNFAPGRHWWIILLAILSTLLMLSNILDNLHSALLALSVFIFSWIMAVFSYILFHYKLFKLTSKQFKFQKGSIPDFNPIGLVSLGLALLIGIPMALGYCGPLAGTLAAMVAGAIAFVMVPIMMALKKIWRN